MSTNSYKQKYFGNTIRECTNERPQMCVHRRRLYKEHEIVETILLERQTKLLAWVGEACEEK